MARLLRRAGREVAVVCTGPPEELRGDARAPTSSACPAAGPVRLDGAPWGEREQVPARRRRGRAVVDALLGTGASGAPRGDDGRGDRGAEGASAPIVSVDVPSGVDASTGVVAGARRAGGRDGHLPRRQARPLDPARQGPRGGRRGRRHRHSPRGADGGAIGLIGPRCSSCCRRAGRLSTKFVSGPRARRGRLARPDRRARDGVASRDAGRRGLRDGARARGASGDHRGLGTPELMTVGLPEADGALAGRPSSRCSRPTARGGALALGPGLGRQRRGRGVFARRLAREAELADGARRGRPERPRRAAGRAGPPAGADRAYAARGRARQAARNSSSAEIESERLRACGTRPAPPARSSC